MKVLVAALSAFVFTAEAKSNVRVSPEKLMDMAIKVDKNSDILKHRKLEDYIQIGSEHSIQFNECISIPTEPYDYEIFYSEYNLGYAQNGKIKSEKSYVLFNVCETDYDCRNKGDDNLYMIELRYYMNSLLGYLPTKQARYCEVCERSQEYCE